MLFVKQRGEIEDGGRDWKVRGWMDAGRLVVAVEEKGVTKTGEVVSLDEIGVSISVIGVGREMEALRRSLSIALWCSAMFRLRMGNRDFGTADCGNGGGTFCRLGGPGGCKG